MKFIVSILLFASMNLFVYGHAQEKITLNEKNALLETILKDIQRQTGYQYFMLDKWKQVAKRIDVSVTNASLSEVLEICFRGQPFTYSIINKIIVVQEKAAQRDVKVSQGSGSLQVRGNVKSESGEPLSGASVTLRGTKSGGVTDSHGQFEIRGVSAGNYVLQVSFVGYQVYETDISVSTDLTGIIAILKQVTSLLDETQVIAYGTSNKRTGTGNVSSLKAADLEKQPVSNVLLAMQGQIPGLFITQSSGFAGSGVTVRIQGLNSIGSGNDPLYVIDGVPYISQLLPTLNSTTGGSSAGTPGGSSATTVNGLAVYGNPLSYINPADIESIDVLKDADATAIYGSRAANGAILITTKKGKSGEQKVELNLQQGWGKVTRRLPLLSLRQYLDMRYEALRNSGMDLASGSPTDPNFYDLKVWDTTRSTDWQRELIGNAAQYTDLQSTVSGGSANTNYMIGAGYHRETAVIPGNFDDQKGSLHFQINSGSTNQKFHLRLTGSYLLDYNRLPVGGSDFATMAMQLPPNAPPLYNKDGSINWAPDPAGNSTWRYPGNPMALLLNTYQNHTGNMVDNVLLSYQIVPGLSVKSSFGYTSLQTNEKAASPLLSTAPELRQNITRSGRYGSSAVNSWIVEPQVNYNTAIAKGKLDALVGTTIQENISNAEQFIGYGYLTDASIADISSANRIVTLSTIALDYKYTALFARANYNWEDKYILNITTRRDGSSRFGPENQFYNFGAIGATWVFTQENYFKEKSSFLSFGKLSGSYGTTGNDQIGDYQFLSLYHPVVYGVPYQGVNTISPGNLSNPYLQWEKTRKLHFGIILGFYKERILLNADYYHNRSSNQLLSYQLPITTGFNTVAANLPADVQNTGWEFSVSTKNLQGRKVNWSTNFNLTIPVNKLISFPELANSSYANVLKVGEPITVVRTYHQIGVEPMTGQYYFLSKSNPFKPQYPDDANVWINNAPICFGGIQNVITCHGFQFDFLFQFSNQKGPNYYFGRFPGQALLNQPNYVLNRWRKPGDVASHQRFDANLSYSTNFLATGAGDAAFSNASYFRLKNISFSWMAPEKSLQKVHLQGLRVYIQAQNLLTLTKYKGLDPETLSVNTLPPLTVVTTGIKLTL
jgi:TonB-linked SusC/RagA family outer membrane protein